VIAECAPPQSDGLKLLRDVKSLTSGQPRVVLSVSARRGELLREAFEGGAMDVITKPFHMSEATARVLYALQRAPLR
jgi:DNA-binding response OmpR family regulator